MIPTSERPIPDFAGRMAPAERAVAEAWWDLATTGTEEAQEELVRAGIEYNRCSRTGTSTGTGQSLVRGAGLPGEPAPEAAGRGSLSAPSPVDRGIGKYSTGSRSWRRKPTPSTGITEASWLVYEVGENEIREILRSSDDEALRREAWEASKTVGLEVEETVRELARLRNRLAREAGYPDHYHRSLDLQEIDAGELDRLMSGLEAATEVPFRELKERLDSEIKEKFDVRSVIMPWHLPDPFFQEPPEGDLDVDRYFGRQ